MSKEDRETTEPATKEDKHQYLCNCVRCTQSRLGRPPLNETISSKIVRAQNMHQKHTNQTRLDTHYGK